MKTGRPRKAYIVTALAIIMCAASLPPWMHPGKKLSYSTVIRDRKDRLLRLTLSDDEKYRVYTPLKDFPPHLIKAIQLQEDRYFRFHPGINPVSIIRSVYSTYIARIRKMGGSTITMQTVRLLGRLDTTHVPGKIRQMGGALVCEFLSAKRDILETYLNIVPCGGNVEGFPAASMIYFGKDIRDLTLEEALLLAVIPQNPVARGPGNAVDTRALETSRLRLLDSWERAYGKNTALRNNMDLPVQLGTHLPFRAPHLTDYLLSRYPALARIQASADISVQREIEALVSRYITRNRPGGVQNAATLLVDFRNMEIISMTGSADYFDKGIQGQVNGTTALRSPGSTLKPFIYALAMEQGLIHPMTTLIDAPTSFSEYSPDNFQSDFHGPIRAKAALVTSRNVPAVYLASRIKSPDLHDFILSAGIALPRDRDHYGLSIVLGGAELSMLDLAVLYGTLANEGYCYPLKDIITGDEDNRQARRILTRQSSYLTLEMLKENPRPSYSSIPYEKDITSPVAYKTGTSIGFKDSWSAGIFDTYIVIVWLGNFDGYGNPAFNGRYLAAPLLFEIVDYLRGKEYQPVTTRIPEGVVLTQVCSVSGMIPGKFCESTIETWFIPGVSPISRCDICREIYIDTRTGYQILEKKGPGIRKEIVEFWPTNLLKLFKKAGIPRRTPPLFDPSIKPVGIAGSSPVIVSPREKVEYVRRHEDGNYNDLALLANTDPDIAEVFWFVDSVFIGKSDPFKAVWWNLVPGEYTVSVVDNHGRSASHEISVILTQ